MADTGKLLLLDMEAPDNETAMKQMQKRAVRSHFVKPVYDIGAGRNHDADLYAYGKTIQFMLAYLEVVPALTKREELRLSRVIEKCIGESKKKYDDFCQILNELPGSGKKQNVREKNGKTAAAALGGAAAGVLLCSALILTDVPAAAGQDAIVTAGEAETAEQQ